MKNLIKATLQSLLGYKRYLRFFAWFKVKTLRWDRRERDFFQFLEQIPEDGLVLDVGANLGFLCAHLARRVRRGRVLAFEPLPDNFEVLQGLIRRLDLANVEACPMAIGDRSGEVEMILPVQGNARQQGLGHVADERTAAGENGITFQVPIRRLDDMVNPLDARQRVAAIKIDVENFERYVLRGARGILQRDHPLVYLELWDNENRRESFAFARELGYKVMVSDQGHLRDFAPALHRGCSNFFLVFEEPGRAPVARAEPLAAVRSGS